LRFSYVTEWHCNFCLQILTEWVVNTLHLLKWFHQNSYYFILTYIVTVGDFIYKLWFVHTIFIMKSDICFNKIQQNKRKIMFCWLYMSCLTRYKKLYCIKYKSQFKYCYVHFSLQSKTNLVFLTTISLTFMKASQKVWLVCRIIRTFKCTKRCRHVQGNSILVVDTFCFCFCLNVSHRSFISHYYTSHCLLGVVISLDNKLFADCSHSVEFSP